MAPLLERYLWTAFVVFEGRASRPERACIHDRPETPSFLDGLFNLLAKYNLLG